MKKTIKLTQANLARLEGDISYPLYNRKNLTAGIVHIGVGGFHRSHEAYYTHLLLNQGGNEAWGICGIGLRKADQKMGDVLKKQDYLYTLITQHAHGKVEQAIIGTIIDFHLGTDHPNKVLDKLADPSTKIVSLTITEGGYNFDPDTKAFIFDHPDIQHDLNHPNQPITVFGFLTAALKMRQAQGIPAFTIQSCDNILHNGDTAKKMLLAFANKQAPSLAEWIEKEVCFPNSMVDRITPVTKEKDRKYLVNNFGLVDEWPVTCEPFCQWVIEDNFSNGRPPWEKVGAQFVPDVTPYEKMKIRLLNAGHSVLGLLGALHGYQTIDACVADPLFSQYLMRFLDEEATPILDSLEGINLKAYKESLIERFGNPNIKDQVSRICSESSAKLPNFLITTIHENLAAKGSIKYATLILAAWCYYSDKQVNFKGEPLEIIDVMKSTLHLAAKGTTNDALSFLSLKQIFGDLIQQTRFTKLYTELVADLYQKENILATMKKVMLD